MKQPTTERTGTGWAVVTGASSGLGREFALALAERGHPVLAVARRGERLSALADEIRARCDRLEPLVADLSTPAGVDALLARAASLELELLVNNAGVATYGPFASTRVEREREFTGVAGSHAAERCFPHLRPRDVVESALHAHDRGRTVKIVGPLYAYLTPPGGSRHGPRYAGRWHAPCGPAPRRGPAARGRRMARRKVDRTQTSVLRSSPRA